MTYRIFLSLIFLAASILNGYGQIDRSSELFRSLKQQDSIFFERTFNRCDQDYLKEHISADFEFYHDQSGFQDRAAFLENTRKNLCSSSAAKPIRKVDVNSLQVFPLYDHGKLYAAIQKGVHHFYLRKKGEEEVQTGTARFIHVWKVNNGNWMLAEVLSYDHRDPAPAKTTD